MSAGNAGNVRIFNCAVVCDPSCDRSSKEQTYYDTISKTLSLLQENPSDATDGDDEYDFAKFHLPDLARQKTGMKTDLEVICHKP